MNFDFAKIPFEQAYKLVVSTVVPRPVAWVVTKDKDGVVNAAPYSFFNAFSDNPVVVGFGCGPRAPGALKDTVANIEATGQFVVNMVSADLAEKMNITAVDFPPGVSEITEAGLSTAPSTPANTASLRGTVVLVWGHTSLTPALFQTVFSGGAVFQLPLPALMVAPLSPTVSQKT